MVQVLDSVIQQLASSLISREYLPLSGCTKVRQALGEYLDGQWRLKCAQVACQYGSYHTVEQLPYQWATAATYGRVECGASADMPQFTKQCVFWSEQKAWAFTTQYRVEGII